MKSKTVSSWSSLLSTNWSMLMVPVGLVGKALANRLYTDDLEKESDCVVCGRTICDRSGVCLADLHKISHGSNSIAHM